MDKMINSKEIKKEIEENNTEKLKNGWNDDNKNAEQPNMDLFVNVTIKEEVSKEVTLKEEPLEIPREDWWQREECEAEYGGKSLPMQDASSVDVLDDSLHCAPVGTPSFQGTPVISSELAADASKLVKSHSSVFKRANSAELTSLSTSQKNIRKNSSQNNKNAATKGPNKRKLTSKKCLKLNAINQIDKENEAEHLNDIFPPNKEDTGQQNGESRVNAYSEMAESALLKHNYDGCTTTKESLLKPLENEPLNLKVKPTQDSTNPNKMTTVNDDLLLPDNLIKFAIHNAQATISLLSLSSPNFVDSENEETNLVSHDLPPLVAISSEPTRKPCDTPKRSKPPPSAVGTDARKPPPAPTPTDHRPSSPVQIKNLQISEGIDDYDLMHLSCRELNRRFREMPKGLRNKYKQRRRTLKNRVYAQTRRQRCNSMRLEIESVNAILKAEVRRRQAELTRLSKQARDLRQGNHKMQKRVDFLRKENLSIKRDWLAARGCDWHSPEEAAEQNGGEGLEPDGAGPPLLHPVPVLEVRPEDKEEEEEEMRNKREDREKEERITREEEEHLLKLKERFDLEQLYLHHHHLLLQQRVNVLQVLQFQQQQQLQLMEGQSRGKSLLTQQSGTLEDQPRDES